MIDRVAITGGAGFIGSHLAARFLSEGVRVVLFDNFTRPGSRLNAEWLTAQGGGRLEIIEGDIRNFDAVQRAIRDVGAVIHLAAQVAVTTSVTEPRHDFEVNALGTFNVLEAARLASAPPAVMYSSTNKVYGKMEEMETAVYDGRYVCTNMPDGIAETQPLDFCSPYGCSKGAGDQYVLDYGRVYGLRTAVFRQSCIYGPRQFGVEDQGWVAWFAIRALQQRPVTIFGDGRQVRDVLFIDDLTDAYLMALDRIGEMSGSAFNIGGGPANTLSLLELVALLEERHQRPFTHSFDEWRPSDQRVFVSDVGKARRAFGWSPRTPVAVGVNKMVDWQVANESLLPGRRPDSQP